jgi:hypothetical protein
MTEQKKTNRKGVIEKAKTWTLISIFAFGIGTAVGFYLNDRLYAKYNKSEPISVTVEAPKTVEQSK